MPWNDADRAKYDVIRERYSSDLSDGEFALIFPLLPARKRRGRKPTCARARRRAVRPRRPRSSSTANRSKTTEAGGPRGFDAAKKIRGRKRHIAVDTFGLPTECQITSADMQDREALAPLLHETHRKSPFASMCFVDSGYNGDEAQRAAFEASRISINVVQRNDKQIKGFIVLPKRWVVERTFGWINRARRLAKDFEATIESALAWLLIALAFLLTRRLARLSGQAT
jgi:transposase